MKKIKNSIRPVLFAAGGLLLLTVLFSACKKDNNNNDTPIPVAGLMGINLAPDKPAVGLAISGSVLTSAPLNYSSFTGFYQNIYPGSREVAAFNYYGGDSAFAKATQTFENNKSYSVFVLGNNGSYQNLIVKDELDSTAAGSGKAFIRYINAIPDSSQTTVTISSSGTDISNSNAAFASISNFTGITPGTITVKVAGTNIAATRDIQVDAGKVYTILLIGVPGAADSEKQVQIRFIVNGTTS